MENWAKSMHNTSLRLEGQNNTIWTETFIDVFVTDQKSNQKFTFCNLARPTILSEHCKTPYIKIFICQKEKLW